MNVDAVVEELYLLPPAEFIKARDALAAEARKEGEKGTAKAIAALRRPTAAAFASNLLVRRRPEEVRALLDLSEALRGAHQSLDGAQLRELSHRQHVVIGALARTARELAVEAGQAVSEGTVREVEQSLHAVVAGAEAAEQWAAGRLTTALTPPAGFPAVSGTAVPAPTRTPATPRERRQPSGETAPAKEAPSRAEVRHREAVAGAEQAKVEAERERASREEALGTAEDEQKRHERKAADAERQVKVLEGQLQQAQTTRDQAREALTAAADQVQEATRAAKTARRAADKANSRIAKLRGRQE
ncbi:hypothetical protein OTB20_23065 [Streptomyces sp. H27-H1]|uniref:hypothetical protein n=1 Tax=Streptomyces sp. H27-H1 TaxID=2996461 RepID=UPI00226E2760|nr:hypothetical protein [Streptomyces sp. H27-H1]MCY0929030.1 hypothetical protein [Streptomyces sp. H27-H1]